MDETMCTNQELQDQIVSLSKQNAKEHKDIQVVLATWTPLMECYQKEVTRSRAYKLVSDDLRAKGTSWKFWLAIISVVLGILSAVFYLAERIKLK